MTDALRNLESLAGEAAQQASPASTTATPSSGLKPLSCKRCRLRKIKCDRGHPCAGCQRMGMECAYPGRLRTRRDPRKHSELLSRIARLESLVSKNPDGDTPSALVQPQVSLARESYQPQLSQEYTMGFWVAENDRPLQYPTNPGPHKSNETHHSSNQFWQILTAEVDGLRQLLDEPSDEEDEYEDSKPSSPSALNTQPTSSLFFNISSAYVDLRTYHPPVAHTRTLCNMYFSRVDPLFKILHKPTAMSSILARSQRLNAPCADTGLEALTFAVYLAAVTSMSSPECIKHFGQSKDVLYERYRLAVIHALNNANFLDDVDVVSLQAFMIFLLCFRFGREKRLAWTLLSLAVRVAHALGLHRESPDTVFTPFETEMRRRLWWQICIHDIWQSEDRGLDPMIYEVSFSTPRPANADDDDLDPSNLVSVTSKSHATIMTFSQIGYEVYSLHTKLHYASPSKVHFDHSRSNWEQQELLAGEFCRNLEENIIRHCDISDSFQWMCAKVAQVIKMKVFLVLHFPLQTPDNTSPPPVDKEVALSNSVTFLELLEDLENNKHTFLWRWHFRSWVQWHALAVTLAELCIQTRGPLVDRGWDIINKLFDKYGERISDAKGSRLGRPIKKLYHKAKTARSDALAANHAHNLSLQNHNMMQNGPYIKACNDKQASVTTIDDTDTQWTGIQAPLANPSLGFQVPQHSSMDQRNQGLPAPAPESDIEPEQMTETVDWVVWEEFLQDAWDADSTCMGLSDPGYRI